MTLQYPRQVALKCFKGFKNSLCVIFCDWILVVMQFWMNKKCAQIHPTHPVPKPACLRQHSTRNFGACQLSLCIRFGWFRFNLVHKHGMAVFFWGKSERAGPSDIKHFPAVCESRRHNSWIVTFYGAGLWDAYRSRSILQVGLSSAHFPGASIEILGIQEFVLLTRRLQRKAYEASKCLKEVKGSIFLGWTLFFLWHLVFPAASLDRLILTNTTDADDDQQHMC